MIGIHRLAKGLVNGCTLLEAGAMLKRASEQSVCRAKKLPGSSSGPRLKEYERQNSRASESSPGLQRAFDSSPKHQRSGSLGRSMSIASADTRPSSNTRWSNTSQFYVRRSAQVSLPYACCIPDPLPLDLMPLLCHSGRPFLQLISS